MGELRSYTKLLALTHRMVAPLREHGLHLLYQEKIDGSQFSFGVLGGVLHFRSKRVAVDPANPGMFDKAVECVQELHGDGVLVDGFTYRGEYLRKPKHNTLSYERVPAGHIILFDIDAGHCDYLPPEAVDAHGAKMGLEVVPWWRFDGEPRAEWLQYDSCLGGTVEGYVIKDYAQIGADGKVLMAKVVRESFKEVHSKEWKKANPGRKDVIAQIIEDHRTEARWAKAVQHLAESGDLVNAPQDIGRLFKEVSSDIAAEEAEAIKERLWQHFRKDILRGCTRGLPDWYKARLAEGGT